MARRSTVIVLTFLASAAAVSLANRDGGDAQQAGPDAAQRPPATMYPDADACAADLGADACRSAFASALEEHEREAPRFVSRENCESFSGGACAPTHWGGDAFVPAMAGFLVGTAAGGAMSALPLYAGQPPGCTPGLAQSDPQRAQQIGCGPQGGGARPYYHGGSYWGWSSHAPSGSTSAVSRAGAGSASLSPRTVSVQRASGGLSAFGSVTRGGIGSTARASVGS